MTIAVGHTDGATAGFGTFGLDNTYFGGIVGNFQAVVATSITSFNDARGVYQLRYDDIMVPCEVVDDIIVERYLNVIANNKSTIQQLGHSGTWAGAPQTYGSEAAALTAIGSLYQGSHTTNDNQACSVLVVSGIGGATAGQVVSQLIDDTTDPPLYATGVVSISTTGSRIVVEDVVNNFIAAGISSTGVGEITIGGVSQGAVSSVSFTGLSKIRGDVVLVTVYPVLEPPSDDSKDNPWEGDIYPILDENTNGIGAAQTFFKNAIDTIAGGNPTISIAPDYGKVYTFNTTSAAGAASSINTLDDEVVELRGEGGSTGITTYMTAANVIKGLKISYAVNIWSYNRGNKLVTDQNSDYVTAIEVLSDPSIGGPY